MDTLEILERLKILEILKVLQGGKRLEGLAFQYLENNNGKLEIQNIARKQYWIFWKFASPIKTRPLVYTHPSPRHRQAPLSSQTNPVQSCTLLAGAVTWSTTKTAFCSQGRTRRQESTYVFRAWCFAFSLQWPPIPVLSTVLQISSTLRLWS